MKYRAGVMLFVAFQTALSSGLSPPSAASTPFPSTAAASMTQKASDAPPMPTSTAVTSAPSSGPSPTPSPSPSPSPSPAALVLSTSPRAGLPASTQVPSAPSATRATVDVGIAVATSTTEFVLLHRMPTQLEEKLEALDCDMPPLPRESRLWKGNETHELLLPITVSPDMPDSTTEPNYSLTWEGAIEIQSGDVLLVRIDEAQLLQQETVINRTVSSVHNDERTLHEPTTSVYQVTRNGHDNCDVTEGILLDITPLKIENRRVVTLYDKDLTEGINLLIVVSDLWGSQCVRLKVVVKSDNCGENEDCSDKGLCYSNVSMDGYECQCCLGYVGPHCEEQDACYPSPCKNNGICVDISQGHEGSMFQCLCPYGYTGKRCEEETDPCTSMPCHNGATCVGNVTEFRCRCAAGFYGPLCERNRNECDSSPCRNGICVDQQSGGYKCYCKPGFTGVHCEYEYNECESSPCINGGTCTDHVEYYTCSCGRGFTGKRCHIKVDLCQPNPCPDPRYCVDHGNNYSCECPKGYSGADCSMTSRAACSTNPCTNGGTCWSNKDSYYCACKPGYTGKTCEDEFVVEKITSLEAINSEPDLDLQMPISIHLDHLHSVYIAAGTLICAVLIVGVVVTVCHCRVNKTYKRFTLRAHPLWGCQARRSPPEPPTTSNSEWFTGKDKAAMATPSRNLPSLDTTDMYYTLDFSDSQSSPLIQ